MCGRFTLRARLNDILAQFDASAVGFDDMPLFEDYNIPPSRDVPVIRSAEGRRQLSRMRWGLIPSWAKDPAKLPNLNNARSETVKEKSSFKSAYKSQRCIVPANGFFEWKEGTKPKQPYYFHRPDGKFIGFGAILARWNDIETFAIVTTGPNDVMEPIHDRLPIMLGLNDYEEWLDPAIPDPAHLLAPCPASELTCYPVSTYVNKPANTGPKCIERISLTSNVLFD